MAEPDDLYTLRAQFWLGHYDMVRRYVAAALVSANEVCKGAKTRVAFILVPILGFVMCSFGVRLGWR